MEESGLFIVHLHHDSKSFGNVAIAPQSHHLPFQPGDDLKIASFSTASDRCFPLVILHAMSNESVLFKMELLESSTTSAESKDLDMLHSTCLKQLKTAIIQLPGGTELHLAAMIAVRRQRPCFWGFLMIPGLYSSCLNMLNLRCLALVFDLDETLIVANTMRSFEDRIDALNAKLKGESDAHKLLGMSAEINRYIEDKDLLQQYLDDDRVWDTTALKFVSAQVEMVASAIEGGISLMRPVIRLQDRNMVFTRIDPNIRDTSVLVRLRPAWEELRNYLTANGRKRFEVFVCTMSEKEYALEMWRLLDPDFQLLGAKEMTDRVVCVKSGSKKSLTDIFANGCCHPKLAMVIDDRIKVWEDRDQGQVHVVPPFAPYYAPQVETNRLVPVLRVARNVASNVRAGFFRDLDEHFARRLSAVDYDAKIFTLPQPPVVNNYIRVEEETRMMAVEVSDGNKQFPDGIADFECGKRLAESMGSSSASLSSVLKENEVGQLSMQALQPIFHPSMLLKQPSLHVEPQLHEKQELSGLENEPSAMKALIRPALNPFEPSPPASPLQECEVPEVPEFELDPNTRRPILILQHGQDTQPMPSSQQNPIEPSFSLQSSLHVTVPSIGGWLGAEEEVIPSLVSRTSSRLLMDPKFPSFGKQQSHGPELGNFDVHCKVYAGDDKQRPNLMFVGDAREDSSGSVLSIREEVQQKSTSEPSATNSVICLQDIAQKSNTKLEFRLVLENQRDRLFGVEVIFAGQKVGAGIGRTKTEAEQKAAESSLRFMAGQFISHPIDALGHGRLFNSRDETAPQWNVRDPRFSAGLGPIKMDEDSPAATFTGQPRYLNYPSLVEPNRAISSVTALKEMCNMGGINVVFNNMSPSESQPHGAICQVELGGRVMSKGFGRSWEEAKQQAAEETLRFFQLAPPPRGLPKRMNPPRSPPPQTNKRVSSGDVP